METRGATLRSDWPGKDQRLPTAREQPPKQEHSPLTLPGNAPISKELTPPPASHNLASGRPSHTVPQPFPQTRSITRKCHRDNKYDHTGKYWHLPSDFQEYQKQCLSQVAGKTGAEKEPPLGSNFNRWTDQHLQGKAITNTGSFRRDQPPTFLPTSAKRSALSKRRISPPPEKGTLYISQKCHRDNK